MYTAERNASKTWNGNIGLIYTSDYGYATDPTLCSTAYPIEWSNAGQTSACIQNNWLFSGNSQHVMTTANGIGANSSIWAIAASGVVTVESLNQTSLKQTRPVIYLKPELVVTDGTGKRYDPYVVE